MFICLYTHIYKGTGETRKFALTDILAGEKKHVINKCGWELFWASDSAKGQGINYRMVICEEQHTMTEKQGKIIQIFWH